MGDKVSHHEQESEVPMATTTVSLKLLIDTNGHKVLFAEAGKDFVDFLFTLLSLPVGTVTRLLSKDKMVGALGKLYESVESLNDTYLPNCNKDTLLKPRSPIGGANIPHLFINDESMAKKVYMCRKGHTYVSDDPRAMCPRCGGFISTEVLYVAAKAVTQGEGSSGGGAGYVKDVTYMIQDNLEVKPMSTISCIAVLNKFNVKEVGELEERMVQLGMDEGLKLLKASLESNSVLSNVFLEKKKAEKKEA